MSELLLQVLEKTLSQNANDQREALQFLEQAATQDLPSFIKELSVALRSQSYPQFVRQAAGLQLKNVLYSKDEQIRTQHLQRWLNMPVDVRNQVKLEVLQTLGTEQYRPSIAAQCIAAIACAEVPAGQWNDCIAQLTNCINNESELLRESALETLGYICQDIDPRVLESQANAILTAIVSGMRKEEASNHVRLAATNALLNALEFTNSNFSRENERNIIMQVVCEATQSSDAAVKVASLQCMVRILTLYYQLMERYMPSLFPITVQAIKSEEDNICLQGIEFWSNVCEEEITLAVEAEEAAENNRAPERVSRHYAKGATPHLCPLILDTLSKQEEGDDDDDWTPAKAAGVCIMLLAQCVGDDILPHVLPFLQNFTNSNWRYKEAAIMAFGSILDGPDPAKLQPLVEQAVPLLVEAMSDRMAEVRDTTAWCFGRILEVCPEIVGNETLLGTLLPVFSNGLNQEPRVANNVCWALIALVKAAYEIACTHGTDSTGQPETFSLTACFEGMINELLKTADRLDGNQSNLRLTAFETLMELIKNSPKDCYPVVHSTTITLLQKLDHLLNVENSTASSADKQQVLDVQALLCATLQSVLRKTRSEDAPQLAQHIMTGLILIMTRAAAGGKCGNVMEEALLAVSALAECLGSGFEHYMINIKPHILRALSNTEESQVCVAAAGLVTDICRALGQNSSHSLDEIMERLVFCLREPKLSRDAKVQIIGYFGDIALAIGTGFERYVGVVMEILIEASGAEITNPDDIDMIDYVEKLRENITNSYVGIVQSMCPEGYDADPNLRRQAQQSVFRFVQPMMGMVLKCADMAVISDALMVNVAGLIGDLVNLYGAEIVPHLNNEKVNGLLSKGKKSKTGKTKAIATWAAKEIRKITTVQ